MPPIMLMGLRLEVVPMEIGQVSSIVHGEALRDVEGVIAMTMLKKSLELQQVMLQKMFESIGIGQNINLLA
jgi:hypothetical protein